jgi:glycosyltransferase involved in cell wall biosynthesis
VNDITVTIVARNAEATVARAVRSARAEHPSEILLVDDWSSDATVERAREADRSMRVIRPIEHRTLGLARQTGLDAVTTPFGVWLDADDEFLPGRVARLIGALQADRTDAATDSVELVDEAGGAARPVVIPAFLRRDPRLTRLFERNYLPAPGPIAFRTDSIRQLGYDVDLHGSEDVDLLLRSVARGTRWSLLDAIGYRQHSRAGSLSRDLRNQRDMYRRALLKHGYADIRALMLGAGWSSAVAAWALASAAIFRLDFEEADRFVMEAAERGERDETVIEPDGPCPLPEAWRYAFHRGTIALLRDRPSDAVAWLQRAEACRPTPEAANNLGMALWRDGRRNDSRAWFEEARRRRPGYVDALVNADALEPGRITTHPLRRDRSRDDYPRADA